MPSGLQIFNADGTVDFDTNTKSCIFTQVVTVPSLPWVNGTPVRTQDITVKAKNSNEEFMFAVLGSSDCRFYEYSFDVYAVSFSTVNNNTIRVTRLAQNSPSMTILVGIVGK